MSDDEHYDKLSPTALKELFLFEALRDDQLVWLADQGRIERRAKDTVVYTEGEPASCFFMLLAGTITLSYRVQDEDVEVVRSDQPGAYAGATRAYLGDQIDQVYPTTMRAITDVDMFVLPAEVFGSAVRTWFPMAVHLLDGLFLGMHNKQSVVGERERLLALGSLSAGLTHELNNPAAAAVRATSVLRDRIAAMRHKLALIAESRIDVNKMRQLVELQDVAIKRIASAPKLSPLATSDAEDVLTDWLDEHGIISGWDLASTMVAGGVDVEWLGQIQAAVGDDDLDHALRWLTYAIDTELLLSEIDDSVTRISTLVGAAKQYSQLDRTPYQTVNVHDLLDATLTMLAAKIPPGVRVVKEYDRALPPIPAYAAELNQVWTNLIDNAIGAMGDEGTLTVRTGSDEDRLAVEISDTGSGISPEIRPRIFEPFFTTKPVGKGTGLGLDISYRIVVTKHHGDIRVDSRPGATTFRVLLPISGEPVAPTPR